VTKPSAREEVLEPVRAAAVTGASRIVEWAKEALTLESEAIENLKSLLGKSFEDAVQALSMVHGQILTM